MQPADSGGRSSDHRGGGQRPAAMPIPGARRASMGDDPRWQAMLTEVSLADSASMDLDASLQDGIFTTSVRRAATDHGYGSLGYGHGAWLSSSPHPASMRGGGLGHAAAGTGNRSFHRTTSLQPMQRQRSAGSGVLSPDAPGNLAAATTMGGLATQAEHSVDLEAGESGATPPTSPLSLTASGQYHRAQRWHLAPPHAQDGPASDLAEPLLSADFSERSASGGQALVSPRDDHSGTGAAAEAAAATSPVPEKQAAAADGGGVGPAAEVGASLPAAPVTIARDASGGSRGGTELSKALVFGMINSVATIPSLVAYAAIVFKDPTFTPYLDQLCKFFFLSSALHQAVFCLLSTLPFSVGQVQDVGLIFLSAMATSIAASCLAAGRDAATALGTSLLTMCIATFFTGAMTLLVARQKLAQLVQYLPLPVIGGYLSFVGYFCVASGIGLGTSLDIGGLATWAQLWNWEAAVKLVPTVASCLAMIATLEHFSHPLALPAVLAAINLLFHAVRLALGVSMATAMDHQWVIRPAEGFFKFWELWGLYNVKDLSFSGIYWPALGEQWIKMLGLALVVIFGSAMDIAAIQQDTPQKIDFNRELITVAVSNMATGVAGCGFTGSYIFSQTIFTMRAGVFNRWNGWVVAISEALMFALPFPVIQWMPNFFFGSLLLWFGIEISRDWLVLSFTKMTRIEYGLLLATFSAIMQWGLEGGIAAGIVLATLYFALAYAKSQVAAIQVADGARSSVVRTVEQQAALDMLSSPKMATVKLNGFVFFGSANSIGQKLQEEAERLGGGPPAEVEERREELEEAIHNSLRTLGEAYLGVKHTQAVAALRASPAYLVLDFGAVRGLDATGARTMGMVYSDLMQQGVVLVVTGADHHGIRSLLVAHGLPLPPHPLYWPLELEQPEGVLLTGSGHGSVGGGGGGSSPPLSLALEQAWEEGRGPLDVCGEEGHPPSCLEFASLEEGLRYCEDQLLEVAVRYGLCQPPSALLPLEDMLQSHLQKLPLGGDQELAAVVTTLRRYMSEVSLSAGQLLWRVDDPASAMFIIEKGAIRVDEFISVTGPAPATTTSRGAASLLDRSGSGRRVLSRSFELGPGCVVGSTDFYLSRPHGTRAVCRSAVARVLRLTRSAMESMAADAPQALNVLQVAVMRANTLDLSKAAELSGAS
ncbi:putative vacuolar membrane protein [Chlorella vulgaris]